MAGTYLSRRLFVLACCTLGLSVPAGSAVQEYGSKDQDRRPSLGLRATPLLSFSPSRVSFTAELKGGADDYEEYYCPTVEWDWGDGTRSEATLDCDPYEAGKSEIRRRFTTSHVFRMGGNYRIQIRLKRKDKVVTSAATNIEVRPGLRDGFY